MPKNITVEDTKTFVPIKDLVTATLSDIVLDEEAGNISIQEGDVLVLDSKAGVDGSGEHKKRQQTEEGNDPLDQGKSYIGAFFCPLEVRRPLGHGTCYSIR